MKRPVLMSRVGGGKNSNWNTGRQELAILARVQSRMYMFIHSCIHSFICRLIDYLSWILCDNFCVEFRPRVAYGRTVWYTVRHQLYDRNFMLHHGVS